MLVKIGLFLFQMQDQSMNQNLLPSSVGTLIISIPNEANHHWKTDNLLKCISRIDYTNNASEPIILP
jgi:hypothetical protein